MDGFECRFCSFSLCFRNCFIVYSVDLNANKTEISSKWDKTVIEPYRIAIINRKWRTYVPPANNKHNISIIFIRHAIAQTARDVCSDWYWGERNKKKHNNKIENTNIRDFYCYFFSRIILLDVWIVLHLVYGLPIMKKTMFINSAPANRTGKIDIVTTVTLVVIQNSSWDHTFFRGNKALPNVLWVPKSDVTICVHHGTRWITQKQPRWQ